MSKKHRVKITERTRNRANKLRFFEKGIIRRCVLEVLRLEQVEYRCEIQILCTEDEYIRRINKEQREIDSATDVLSFPAYDFAVGGELMPEPDTGCVYLGDIVISLEKARQQAKEFGHSSIREMGYLATHATLHLFGYDHEEEVLKGIMRTKEEAVMDKLNVRRI